MPRKPKPPTRGRPALQADLTAILTIKLRPADHEQLTAIADEKGLTYGGRGAPGPQARRVIEAYLHDADVRKRVDAYRGG